MKYSLLFILLFLGQALSAQPSHYLDSVTAFRNQYITTHGVIKEKDRAGLQFFPIDTLFLTATRVERIFDAPWFAMETSGKVKKTYRIYAILHFTIQGTPLRLSVYQSQQLMETEAYKDYLFIPFTDLTSGETSYAGGRYLDLLISDISNNSLLIDFNKAYNPYCAYATGFNCPIPPRENNLSIDIKAGEMNFGKTH